MLTLNASDHPLACGVTGVPESVSNVGRPYPSREYHQQQDGRVSPRRRIVEEQ